VFYRRLNDEQYTSADLTGTYEGYPVFIIAGNPIIKQLPLHILEASRLPTLALNNVPYSYPNPTMWLTADKPACFGGHLYARPDIIKFAYMNYRDEIVPATGKKLKEHPLMLLYTATEAYSLKCFFSTAPAVAWWKSVFPISLQIAWRLGARRIYLVGCSFNADPDKPYAWDVDLTDRQAAYSQLTYEQDLERLRELQPTFKENRLQVISCTPNSAANEFLPYVDLSQAVITELGLLPAATPLSELKHSSETA
jgi:hypothetical protein